MRKLLLLLTLMVLPVVAMTQNYQYDKYYFEDNGDFTFTMKNGEVWVTGVKNGVDLQGAQIPAKVIYVHEDYPVMQMVGYTYEPTIIRTEYDVVGLGGYVFREHEELTSVTLPANITKLSGGAFSGCTNLEELIINGPVTEIPGYLIQDCSSLKSLKIPSTVTSISYRSFYHATGLETIVLPEGVTVIPEESFIGCTNLRRVVLPSTVTSIKNRAFEGCSSLASMEIPSGVTEIGMCAFSNCSSLKSVVLPPHLTAIGNSVFAGCGSLATIAFPESVTTIEQSAFKSSGLTSLVIPSTVESIADRAFGDCNRLRKVIIEDRETPLMIGRVDKKVGQFYSSPLEYVYIGGDLVLTYKGEPSSSSYYPFRRNKSLRRLVFGGGATEIPTYAFECCYNLQRLDLSKSINSIGNYAFRSCPRLKAVIVNWVEPVEGDDRIFDVEYTYYGDELISNNNHTYDNATLYIKGVSTNRYKSVSPWKLFKNQQFLGVNEEPHIDYNAVQGDLNGDDEIDVTDVVELIDMVLAGIYDPAGDINGDGEVDVTDVVELTDMVLAGE